MNGIESSAAHELTSHPTISAKNHPLCQPHAMAEHRSPDDDDESSLESETYPPGYVEEVSDIGMPTVEKGCAIVSSGVHAEENVNNVAEESYAEVDDVPLEIHENTMESTSRGDGFPEEAQDDSGSVSSDDEEEDYYLPTTEMSDAVKQAQQALSQLQQLDSLRQGMDQIQRDLTSERPPVTHVDEHNNSSDDDDDEEEEEEDATERHITTSSHGVAVSQSVPDSESNTAGQMRRAYSCHYCERSFATVKALQSHTVKVHNPEKLTLLQCNICFKTFLDDVKLQEHQMTHNMENTHPCPKCARRFKSKLKLRDHLASHNPEQRLLCPFKNCEKSFVSQKLYDNHVAKHDNQQLVFTCPVCEMEFKRRSHRSEHVRVVHAGVKAYQCTHADCSHRFTTENARDNHVTRAHQGSRRYRCSQCTFSASHAPQLEEHCREAHPNMDLSLTVRSLSSIPPQTAATTTTTGTNDNGSTVSPNHPPLPNATSAPRHPPPPSSVVAATSSSTLHYPPSTTQPQVRMSPTKSSDLSMNNVTNCFELDDPTVSNLKQTVNGILADLDRDLYLPKPPVATANMLSPPLEPFDPYPNLSRVMTDVLIEIDFSPETTMRWQPYCDSFTTEEWMQLQNEEREMGPEVAGCCVLEYPHPFLLPDNANTPYNNSTYLDLFSPTSGHGQNPYGKKRGRPRKNGGGGGHGELGVSSSTFSGESNVNVETGSHVLQSPRQQHTMSLSTSPEKVEKRFVEHHHSSVRHNSLMHSSPLLRPHHEVSGMSDHCGGGGFVNQHGDQGHPSSVFETSISPPSFHSNHTAVTSVGQRAGRSHKVEQQQLQQQQHHHYPQHSNHQAQSGEEVMFSAGDDSVAILNELMSSTKSHNYATLGSALQHTLHENARLQSPRASGDTSQLEAQLLSLAAFHQHRQAHEMQIDTQGMESDGHHGASQHQQAMYGENMSHPQRARWNSTTNQSTHESHQQAASLEYGGGGASPTLQSVSRPSPSSMSMAALSAADLLRQYGACVDPTALTSEPPPISWSSQANESWNNAGATMCGNPAVTSFAGRTMNAVSATTPLPSLPTTAQYAAPLSHTRLPLTAAAAGGGGGTTVDPHFPASALDNTSPNSLSVAAAAVQQQQQQQQQHAAMAAMAAAMYQQNHTTQAFEAASAVANAQRNNQNLAASEYHRNLMSAGSTGNPYAATELYYQMAAANAAAYGKYNPLGGLYAAGNAMMGNAANEGGANVAAELSAMQRFAGLSMPQSALYARDAAASAYLNGQSAAAFYAAAAASQAAAVSNPGNNVNNYMSPHMAYAAGPATVGAIDYLTAAAAGRHLTSDPYHTNTSGGYLPHL